MVNVFLFAWICVDFGQAAQRHPTPRRQVLSGDHPSVVNCTWREFEQPMDHFGGAPGTFKQRYCFYDKFWREAQQSAFSADVGQKGPLFFYTGNESPLEEYVNNTGLMWEVGQRLGALLVWAEHRYEPLTHPSLVGTSNCFAYATTAQALADYVALISAVKKEFTAGEIPAVAFGGSYGGMLAGWLRMKYPEAVVGSIAASAPIWGLASTLTVESLDRSAQAISRGVSKAGGATDQCMANIRSGWSLIKQVGRTRTGLQLLGHAAKSCNSLSSARELTEWIEGPWFDMAEGDYPFESTYITYAVGPGYLPLPAWPMRVACESLNKDFGVEIEGSVSDVKYTLRMGDIEASVDWDESSGNGNSLTEAQIRQSGVLDLVAGLRDAVAVWYNITHDRTCFDMGFSELAVETTESETEVLDVPMASCPERCPPCPDCPPCPVAHCEAGAGICDYKRELSKTFSWTGVVYNEDLNLHNNNVQGVGRDMFWPPSVNRGYTVEDIVGPHTMRTGPASRMDREGLYGAPTLSDRWSGWLEAYYGSSNITHHRNIVWSNGALDPWSGAGVYPVGGGPEGPMVQNISSDGSQLALVIDLGAHHTDLFFADPRDPPTITKARAIEEHHIVKWCQEAYDAHKGRSVVI